jgi:hypothetical protein
MNQTNKIKRNVAIYVIGIGVAVLFSEQKVAMTLTQGDI